MRVLVTGASGFVGSHLVPDLGRRRHEVIVLRRRHGGALASSVALDAPEDLAANEGWDAWPSVDAVVHLAALNPGRGETAFHDEAALMRANVEATRVLAERAAAAGARRFVFLSTANVHPAGEGPARAGDPLRPQNAYAASKLAAEQALWEVADASGLEICILRPPPIYGRRGRGGLAQLVRLAQGSLPLPFGALANRRSVLAVQNVVDAIALALHHPEAAGETFLLADSGTVSTAEIIRLVRAATGRRPGLYAVPVSLLRAGLRIAGGTELAERLYGSFVVDDQPIRQRLAWHPPMTTEAALAVMLGGPNPDADSR
ncbi:NAD-dependent epimerase/dehydratase family protein [Consotaella aegiceratis]|uniref:NAD-dependent epimerase/dehydratase family protein n=1 Tax=Consotaella aegiceratis TaxID=3097961 RepID=UPI002F42D277